MAIIITNEPDMGLFILCMILILILWAGGGFEPSEDELARQKFEDA